MVTLKGVLTAFLCLVIYYAFYGTISSFIVNMVGDNAFVKFLALIIPFVLFGAIIFAVFTGKADNTYHRT